MRRRGKLLVGVFTVAAAVLVGCSERSTPTEVPAVTVPELARAARPDHGAPLPGHSMPDVLKRRGASRPESASRVIGPRGGVIELQRSGLRVTFARGAVSAPVRITLSTASAGGVAYEFQPHGLRFAAPVTVEQNLGSTVAGSNAELASTMAAAYFSGSLEDGTAEVLEYRPLSVSVQHRKATFTIEHFSGYLISVGRRGGR
jgi:hypothetical protein